MKLTKPSISNLKRNIKAIFKPKTEVPKRDTQINPEFEDEYIGNNTYKSGAYGPKRPATNHELGGLVRKTTKQQGIIDNSGVNVKPKKTPSSNGYIIRSA